MSVGKHTDAEIMRAVKQVDAGSRTVADVAREMGVSDVTVYRWCAKYQRMSMSSKPVPIPSKSVVRLARADRATPGWRKDPGKIFRVGYYSRQDGLDCVWRVSESGEYEQTTNHDYLYKYFDVIQLSDETSLFGRDRPPLTEITRAKQVQRRKRKRT